MVKRDCYWYHCEHQMGASIDCCTLANGLGDCPCSDDCHNYITNEEVTKRLKAPEPRVMALEEALNCLVIEYRSGKLQEVGKRVFTEGFEYYGDLWRVWDRMPTDEQREAIPWNAQN